MIISVVRLLKWTISDIKCLYLDDGYDGLVFWYNDAKEYNDELKSKTSK